MYIQFIKEKKKREKEASVLKYSENDDHVTLMLIYGHKTPESACIPYFFVIRIQKMT